MNTIPLVLFTLGKENYAIPANQVREIVRSEEITPLPQSHGFIEGVLNLRGRMITIIDLQKCLEVKGEEKPKEIIVVRIPKALVGLKVNKVEDILSVSEELIHEPPVDKNIFLGLLQQEKRRSIPVLNVEEILQNENFNAAVSRGV